MFRWWTSDPHYNHPNIVRYCSRPQLESGDLDANGYWISPDIAFKRAEKMNSDLMRNANARIKLGDMVVCVGDFSCRGGERGTMGIHMPPAEILSKLNGTWAIIDGNHDKNNDVKSVADFMTCRIAKYQVGVQHRPLFDEESYLVQKQKSLEDGTPWRQMTDWALSRERRHTAYCQDMFDFIVCGHVHNFWKVRKIAGIWHVNVGVDVNKYMPVNDSEVALAYERARRNEKDGNPTTA